MHPSFEQTKYYARKKFWKIFGGEIRLFTADKSRLLLFVKQKAFKLKEDITVFTDEAQTTPVLKIAARAIIDFSAAYDITDMQTRQKVGAMRRKGFKSILRDSWEILDASDNVIGSISEDSMGLALLRRFLTNLVPQRFDIKLGENLVGQLSQTFNPFIPQFEIDFSLDTNNKLDRRLGIGAVILLQIIEGRQQ